MSRLDDLEVGLEDLERDAMNKLRDMLAGELSASEADGLEDGLRIGYLRSQTFAQIEIAKSLEFMCARLEEISENLRNG